MLLWAGPGMASQIAVIAKEEAWVYSDPTLQVPIGKLSAGAKVHIGHKTKRDGTVIAAYVAGKLAYLKTEDLMLQNDGGMITEHRVEEEAEDKPFRINKDFSLAFSIFKMDLGKRWRGLSHLVQDEEKDYFNNYQVMFQYRDPKVRYLAAIGLGYYLQQQVRYSFEGLTGEISAGVIPWQWKFISYELIITGIFSGSWRVQSKDNESNWVREKVMAWGHALSAQVAFFPNKKLSAAIGWSYKYIYMKASDVYVATDNQQRDLYAKVPRIGGASFYLTASYRF